MIQNNDFVEITYTGSLKDDGTIFDTTNETLAKDQEIHNEKMEYGPVVICVGKEQVLGGLDKSLPGKEVNKEYSIDLAPEDAFGKKDSKMIQLIPTNKFVKENIAPQPGLQVNIDGIMGTIKTVSGGRTLVDFNHPLSGKEVVYTFTANKIITDAGEKLKSYVKMKLNVSDVTATVSEKKGTVLLPTELPTELTGVLTKELVEAIPEVKEVVFEKKTEEKLNRKKKEDSVNATQ
jgi:FKBP-type peptidyl-prolyl cis-trans isomerase SlyD